MPPRSTTLSDLRFLVVGADGTGKSTFMRHALDLKKAAANPAVASKKMSLEGAVFLIRLEETSLDDVGVDDDLSITWPAGARSDPATAAPAPPPPSAQVDGVLAIYDVSRRDTLTGIPDLLNACSRGRIPCVLVATKCDLPPGSRDVDPREVERSCMRETGIEGCQTRIDQPDMHKRCISIVLRNVISNHSVSNTGFRSRSSTTTSLASPSTAAAIAAAAANAPPPPSATHARATSVPSATGAGPGPMGTRKLHTDLPAIPTSAPRQLPITSPVLDEIPKSPPLELHGDDLWTTIEAKQTDTLLHPGDRIDRRPSPRPMYAMEHPRRRRPDTPTTIADSLIDGPSGESDNGDADAAAEQERKDSDATDGDDGLSLEELVMRLVSMPMSKEDIKFNAAFLCLYRKFAAPSQLLAVIINRFEALDDDDQPQILQLDSQLRLVATLARWVAEYPGDFAYPITRHYLSCFLEHLAATHIFVAAVSEIVTVLDLRVADDDAGWATSDTMRGEVATLQTFPRLPYLSEYHLPAPDHKDDDEFAPPGGGGDVVSFVGSTEAESVGQTRVSSSAFSGDRSASVSTSSFSLLLDSVGEAQRLAELLGPLSRVPLGKMQWHQLMEYPDEEVALEMTRIDWIMYSAIRPRDLIRHVSLTEDKREKCRSLDHVNRMINHFNHVAFWTSNVILLRDKPKHRARALEKFMGVAWKLRQLSNYNSLGAIIAGIHGTPVHRLTQTRELVSPLLQREFMRLEILMGTQKSHFAYRLAWDNTIGEKIPFLPLHRRDLVSTEEGNATFAGTSQRRVNWSKFQIMGDTMVSIQESQGTPYPQIPRNVEIQRLILDAKFAKDEDALYARSLQVEAPASNETRRRLGNWLSR